MPRFERRSRTSHQRGAGYDLRSNPNTFAILFAVDVESKVVGLIAGLPRQQHLTVVIRGRLSVDDFCECRRQGNFPHPASVSRDAKEFIGGVWLSYLHIEDRHTWEPGSKRDPGGAGVGRAIHADVGAGE